jgi:hypothetical protein
MHLREISLEQGQAPPFKGRPKLAGVMLQVIQQSFLGQLVIVSLPSAPHTSKLPLVLLSSMSIAPSNSLLHPLVLSLAMLEPLVGQASTREPA